MGSKVHFINDYLSVTPPLTIYHHPPPPSPIYTHSKVETSPMELGDAGGKRMQLEGSEQGSIVYVYGKGFKFGKLSVPSN